MDESYAVNTNHSHQHQNAMMMQIQEQHNHHNENFNYQNHYRQHCQDRFLDNSQNIQNPNYYCIDYNNHQQQQQRHHQHPPGYYQINQTKINNQFSMDTGQNPTFFNNFIQSSNNKNSSKISDEPSSLQSTPHSTPSVSSLSLSSNSSISFGANESNINNKNLNARSVIATIYDTNDHQPYNSLMKKQQNELNQINSSQENHNISLKRSNDASLMSLPKYVKPKICKSSLVIQSVNSKQIAKPQPQLATLPPSQYITDIPSKTNDNINKQLNLESNYDFLYPSKGQSQFQQNQHQLPFPPPPPPPVPPPPTTTESPLRRPPPHPSAYSHSSNQNFSFLPQRPPPPPPIQGPHSQYNNYNPPPPLQRPISPPKVPPPILRNHNQYSGNFIYSPQLSNSTLSSPKLLPSQAPHQTIQNPHHNNLLNTVLNNSFNKQNQDHNNTYESSFNTSTCSSTQNNNSVYNYLNTTQNSQANANYQALMISPNLRTLFDNKKPPPPYPGNKNNNIIQTDQQVMMMDTSIDIKPLNQTINSTSIRTCTPQAFKFFMEQHAENILKHHKAREFRRIQLENEMNKAALNPDIKEQMRKILQQKETNYLRLRRAKMNKSMFEHIKVLGIGAFGEVNLVRKKDDPKRLYAMKILHKSDVFNRNQAAHVKAERDILAEADNEWVVKLYYSFQDEENLYFCMDYVPGGDLMNLLIKLQVFDENLARFYIAELTCAIESVHNLGFIHRDIKPDNILIDKNGHIKLTDFGLCTGFHWTHNSKYYVIDDAYDRILEKKLSHLQNATSGDNHKRNNQRLMAHSLVGTPNYIAPEILSRKGYTKSCDWWSVGVILFEMVVGEPPFRDDTALGTQSKVINWQQTLKIPDECELSNEVKDLIFKLCTNAEQRLGAEEIKQHAFFKNFDLGPNLRRSKAPYVPVIKYPTDTSNFEPIDLSLLASRKLKLEELNRTQLEQEKQNFNNFNASSIMYEFTFRRFFEDSLFDDDFFRDYGVTSSNISEETSDSFSNLIRNSSKNAPIKIEQKDEQLNNYEEDNEIDELVEPSDKLLSSSLTNMMAMVSTTSKPSNEHQTDKTQFRHTNFSNLINKPSLNKENLNSIKYDYENTNIKLYNSTNYENLKHFEVINNSNPSKIPLENLDESMNSNNEEQTNTVSNSNEENIQSAPIFV